MRTIKEARYWNTGGHGISIVAVITKDIDWAAYIGADSGYSETACIASTKNYGAKLCETDALHFFPFIELPYRN